jgi:hypothetical protein
MRRNAAFLAWACLVFTVGITTTAAAQCEGISWSYDTPFLTIRHDTEYNCAVFDFSQEVALQGEVLFVREHAITAGWADCMCPYFTAVQIGGLPAGAYTLRFEYGEAEVDQPPAWWTWCEMPVVIPGTTWNAPDVLMVNSAASGCGIVTSVADPPLLEPSTWSTMKALYR